MSKLYKCDMCGRFDFKSNGLKTIVAIDHQNEDDFLAKYNYKQDVIIGDICPICLEKVKSFINNIKMEQIVSDEDVLNEACKKTVDYANEKLKEKAFVSANDVTDYFYKVINKKGDQNED